MTLSRPADQSAPDIRVAARSGIEPELADFLEPGNIGNGGADLEVFLAGESQVGEPDSQVLAGRHALLGVEIAAGGRELQGAAVGAEPEIGIALGQVGPGAGKPVGQSPMPRPSTSRSVPGHGTGEIETEACAA